MKLVNGGFGDPALYLQCVWEKRALLFDLGQITALRPGEILRVSDVFVTHTHIDHFIGFDHLLRVMLNRIANEKRIACGKDEKMESLYDYLTGSEFSQRVEAVVEAFAAMKKELDQEKRAIERAWAKREKQIQQGIFNIAGMYGEMQGIVGASLPQVSSLELKALSEGSEGSGE